MPDQVIEINPELHEITFISVDVSSYGRFLPAGLFAIDSARPTLE